MTKEILSPELSVVSNTPKKLSSATQTQLDGVVSKITGLLTLEWQQELKEKNERMKILLEQLQEAIEKRSEEIGYGYNSENYNNRLCQSDEFLEKVFQEEVLWNAMIKNIYEKMIKITPEIWRKTMKERLKKDYFENLIYESIKEYQLKEGNLSLSRKHWWEQNSEKIEKIIKTLPLWLKSLDFSWNVLSNKVWKEFEKIMRTLPAWLKSLNLSWDDLWDTISEDLQDMIKNLPLWLKNLNLSHNSLWKKTSEEMVKIMRVLPVWLKILYLWDNDIPKETQEQLQKQFPNIHFTF